MRLAPRLLAASLALVVTLSFGALPVLAARVVVNGTALPPSPAPIERAGRLYVPLRAIFESLGASVVYQNGAINATSGSRTVSLRIGSTNAVVDGRNETLDAPPFIVGATTYVPLRFCSQALGANVNYDSSNAIAYVDRGGGGGRPIPVNPRPQPIPAQSQVQLRSHSPSPGESVGGRRPTISADFTHRVVPDSIRISLDGATVSSNATRTETGFVYEPPSPLQAGRHVVKVSGQDTTGAHFERQWAFTTGQQPVTPNYVNLSAPQPNATVGRSFVVRGNTLPNARVRVIAGRTSANNLNDVFTMLAGGFNREITAGPRGNFEVTVNLTFQNPGRIGLTVSSTASDTDQGAQRRLILNGMVPQPR